MQKLNFAILFGIFMVMLFTFGCSSNSSTTQYVCANGATVTNPSDCSSQQSSGGVSVSHGTAPTSQPAETSNPSTSSSTEAQTQPSEPVQERELRDKCVTIPESEYNTTEITEARYSCYTNTYFVPAGKGQIDYSECDEIIFNGYKAFCNGLYSGFLNDNAKCHQYEGQYRDSCITGYAAGMLENHENLASVNLCDGIANQSVMENCLNFTGPYLPCNNNDDVCPLKCSYLTDSDCPTYALGQKAISKSGMEITISGPARTDHCYTNYDSEYLDDVDYGYYYVLSASSKNSGTQAELISYSDFVLVDSRGTQHEAEGYLVGQSCQDASPFEQKTLYPGSSETGELWFGLGDQRTLPSGEIKIVYDPNTFIDGDEMVFVVG